MPNNQKNYVFSHSVRNVSLGRKIMARILKHSVRNATIIIDRVAFLTECRDDMVRSIFYRAVFPTGILNNLLIEYVKQ
jgi:hypothetical protein